PLTLLEAMARGLPVLATRVGGNAEVVADGETGMLVPARQPQALAAALVQLVADPARLVRLGRAARDRVTAHFDVRNMVAQYETPYQSLARPRPAKAPALSAAPNGHGGQPL